MAISSKAAVFSINAFIYFFRNAVKEGKVENIVWRIANDFNDHQYKFNSWVIHYDVRLAFTPLLIINLILVDISYKYDQLPS